MDDDSDPSVDFCFSPEELEIAEECKKLLEEFTFLDYSGLMLLVRYNLLLGCNVTFKDVK